jgi:hypothetical protein
MIKGGAKAAPAITVRRNSRRPRSTLFRTSSRSGATFASSPSRPRSRQPAALRTSFHEAFARQILECLVDVLAGGLRQAIGSPDEVSDLCGRSLPIAELEDDDGGVVQVMEPVLLGSVDHETVFDGVDLEPVDLPGMIWQWSCSPLGRGDSQKRSASLATARRTCQGDYPRGRIIE